MTDSVCGNDHAAQTPIPDFAGAQSELCLLRLLPTARPRDDVYDRVLPHPQRGQRARQLDRITHIASDLESVKVKAKSLFETLNLAQNPDGLRILDQGGHEVFFWTPEDDG